MPRTLQVRSAIGHLEPAMDWRPYAEFTWWRWWAICCPPTAVLWAMILTAKLLLSVLYPPLCVLAIVTICLIGLGVGCMWMYEMDYRSLQVESLGKKKKTLLEGRGKLPPFPGPALPQVQEVGWSLNHFSTWLMSMLQDCLLLDMVGKDELLPPIPNQWMDRVGRGSLPPPLLHVVMVRWPHCEYGPMLMYDVLVLDVWQYYECMTNQMYDEEVSCITQHTLQLQVHELELQDKKGWEHWDEHEDLLGQPNNYSGGDLQMSMEPSQWMESYCDQVEIQGSIGPKEFQDQRTGGTPLGLYNTWNNINVVSRQQPGGLERKLG